MKDNINITEEDIFLFIKYPNSLSSEKKIYIADNPDQFKEALEHYSAFIIPLSETEIDELNNTIEKKIYNTNDEVIFLTPTWIYDDKKNMELRLAAASARLEKKTDSVSFTDASSKYLVRIVKTEEKQLLYMLFAEDKPLPMKIKLLPAGSEHIIYDFVEPIDITDESSIECIIIL